MSDKQPLLKPTSKLLDDEGDGDEDNTKTSSNRFSDWRHCFNGERADSKYEKMNDENKNTEKSKRIGMFQLFRYANRYDVILKIISFLLLIVHTVCVIANLGLYGKVTGIFAIESFENNCQYDDYGNLKTSINNLYDCPPGIELNAFNYERLHKLCYNDTKIITSTKIAFTGPLLREKVMNAVHWLILIGILVWAAIGLKYFMWSVSIKRQTARMNISLFTSLIQRKIEYLDTNTNNNFNSNLFTNITKIERGIGFEFFIMFGIVMCTILSITIAFFINWELSLILSCTIPIVLIGSAIFSRLVTSETENELRTYSKAGHIVQEVFSSIRTVFSLNGAKFERQRYEKELDPACWSNIRKGAVFGIFEGWLQLASYLVFAVGFIFGSMLMSYGKHGLDLSNILIVVMMFSRCVTYFGMMAPLFQSFSEGQGAAVSVFQLIDEGNDPNINEKDILREDSLDEESIPDIIGDIQFHNVNLSYISRKDITVLKNLNIIARSNQTTALVGTSGSGKSTCISLLLRFYEPSSGHITIDDRPIRDYPMKQLRKSIGVVSQEPILFGMSIYENIRLGKLSATRQQIEEAAKEANAHNFIMNLPDKYETLVGERGIQLSGGEKQRIALARALVKQPSILLLDEATSALDNVSEKIVQEALDRACKNRTTIVIAHRLSTIQNADQIYVLDQGNVIEEGKHEILMAKEGGKYQTLVKQQQMQRMTDDDNVIIEKVTEQDDKETGKRSRLLSKGELITTHKRESIVGKKESLFVKLLSMNKPEWVTITIGCVTCLISGICQPIFAVLLANIIHSFKGCDLSFIRQRVFHSSLIFFFLGIFLLIISFFQSTAFGISGAKLIKRIRAKAFACLLRQEVAYFDQPENSSGSIDARLSSGAAALQDMAGARLGVILQAFALTGFGILFGLAFSVELTIIIFLPMIFLTIAGLTHVYLSKSLTDRLNIIQGEASALATDVLQNMRTIKQLSVEKEIIRRYSEIINKALVISCKTSLYKGILSGIYWGTDPLMLALLFWRALILVEDGDIDKHDIIYVFSFAMFMTQSMKILGFLAERIGASLSSAEVFFDLFDRIPAIDNTSNKGQEITDFQGEIQFEQVKFVYPTRPGVLILDKLQLHIKPGQRIAIIGTSGCGKSTTIQLLERFYDTIHGRILLDGVDIRQLNLQWVRSRLGLVSQEPILFDLTIAENITYGLDNVSQDDIINAARKANIHDFIQQLPQGYNTNVGAKGCFLSGGEKQRIAIARVLLRQPKVLLLDEATSALDSYNEQIVQVALDQAQTDDPTRTSIIIAHRLSTIRSCDLICVIDKGHIVETGTHTELVQQRGIYFKMLTTQNNS